MCKPPEIVEKKVLAYELLRQINGTVARARELQNELAQVEAEIAELEKTDV